MRLSSITGAEKWSDNSKRVTVFAKRGTRKQAYGQEKRCGEGNTKNFQVPVLGPARQSRGICGSGIGILL